MNDDPSIRKLGGTCAILVGVSHVLLGIITLLDPTRNAGYFWQTLVQSPEMFLISRCTVALGALLAFAVIPAVAQLLWAAGRGWVRWMSSVAYLGFAVMALSSVQDASVDVTYFDIDPYHWLSIVCIGAWLFVVNLLALRVGAWPKLLACLGIAAASMSGCALIGNIPGSPMLFTIPAALGEFVLGPIWFIWTGLRLGQIGAA